ncbi:MAG: hypothetical protein QME94_16245 [Anaerolineae bacterium]|nr:hypothetical protein [Anaerolineae bacterium]
MSGQAARAGLGLAFFVAVASALVLPLQVPGSAEFVVTVLALAVGLVSAGAIAFVIRRLAR